MTHASVSDRHNGPLGSGRPSDVVVSADGSRIYASGADGAVRVYHGDTGELLATWPIGTSLGAIDLSPDGSFLLVLEAAPVSSTYADPWWDNRFTVAVYKVDVATGQKTTFLHTATGFEWAFNDVAIMADGTAFLSQKALPGWSAWVYPEVLNTQTGVFISLTQIIRHHSILSDSADGQLALLAEYNNSDAALRTYASGTSFAAFHGSYDDDVMGFNYGVQALSVAGNRIAQHVPGDGLHIYDSSLHYQMDLTTLHPGFLDNLAGLAFDSTGAFLFVLDSDADAIVQLSTSTWAIVSSIPLGMDLTGATGDFGSRLIVGPNMRYFTVVTQTGLLQVDNPNVSSTITGTAGVDNLVGTGLHDVLEGLDGDDHLAGGAGADTLIGGAGDDTYTILATDSPTFEDTIVELADGGFDQIRTTLATFSLAGLPEIESLFGIADIDFTLTGNDRDNYLIGLGGDDTLEGGLGNDKLEGNGGADTMRGGPGDDEYVVGEVGDVVVENAGEGNDTIWTSLADYSLVGTEIENLYSFSEIPHNFRGNAAGNVIFGGNAGNFIQLQDGGDDEVYGGDGNDVFLFGATLDSDDAVYAGLGTDQIAIQGDYAGAEALVLGSNVLDIENIAILPGNDMRFGDPGTNFYDYEITTTEDTVAPGVRLVVDANRLRPGEDFTFNGSAETDGSFFIYGGGGTDILTGGAKNDVFIFGGQNQWGSSDVVTGGAGIDQLALRGNYTIVFGAGQLIGIEQIAMVSAQDTRYGALGSSYSYNLTMVDANVDGIQMTIDAAPLRPGETLTFNGSAEDDGSFRVFGGRGNDTIVGSQNGDIIAGRLGQDSMTGNGGADTFRFDLAEESAPGAADHILDFTPGSDKIDLSRIDANTHAEGNQAFTWIGSDAFGTSGAASAGQLRAYESNGSWFVEGDTDGNGAADFVLQLTLVGPVPLGQGDFLL